MAGFTVSLETMITNIALRELQTSVPLLSSFAVGVEQGKKSLGDDAKVFLVGAPGSATPFDKATNNYATSTAADLDAVKVPLDKLLKITKKVTRQQLRNGLDLQVLISSMTRQIVRDAVANAMTKITAATFGAAVHTGLATLLTVDKMADLAGTVADLGWDESKLVAFLKTAYYQNLVKDDDLKIIGGATAEAIVKQGRVNLVSGWGVQRFPGIPSNGENLVGFLTNGNGLAIGLAEAELEMGVEKQLEMYEVVKDPETGFTVSILMLAAGATNECFLTTQILSGAIAGRTDGLKRLASA
jgi:hypothetical protein